MILTNFYCFVSVVIVLTSIGLSFCNAEDVYTKDEIQALGKFRIAVKNLISKENLRKDYYLIHWLRARNLDVAKATQMLEEDMIWRKEGKMDEILEDKEMLAYLKLYPSQFGVARDKKGQPGFQVAFREWDIRKGVLMGHNFRRFLAYLLERMYAMTLKEGHSHWIFLVDMNQYNLRQHACVACISFYVDLVTQYEKHYPNTAEHIYLINTPRIFEGVLQIIQRLMSPHTRKIMKIFGVDKQEWQPVILGVFDPQQLTRQYGGTLTHPKKIEHQKSTQKQENPTV